MFSTMTFAYENLSYSIAPAVAGMILTIPAATALVNGQTVNLTETAFDLSGIVGGAGQFTVYITPNGYRLEVLRPDATIENPRTVFPDTNSAYWVCYFELDGTETDLANVYILVLQAEGVMV
ncbi:hypothetical protein JCM15765_02750 [Paradesulfitobacterium aromaticivorans]